MTQSGLTTNEQGFEHGIEMRWGAVSSPNKSYSYSYYCPMSPNLEQDAAYGPCSPPAHCQMPHFRLSQVDGAPMLLRHFDAESGCPPNPSLAERQSPEPPEAKSRTIPSLIKPQREAQITLPCPCLALPRNRHRTWECWAGLAERRWDVGWIEGTPGRLTKRRAAPPPTLVRRATCIPY
jgi:hypothetical protein